MKLHLKVDQNNPKHPGLIFYQEVVEEIHNYLLTKSARLTKENISEEWDNIFESPQFHIYKDIKHFKKIERIYTLDGGPIDLKTKTSDIWGPGLRNNIRNLEIYYFKKYVPHISLQYTDINSDMSLELEIDNRLDSEIKDALSEIVNKDPLAKEY